MRLFIAIPLPEYVKSSLRELQQPIEGVRWTDTERYHLTLRFIGDVDQAMMGNIRSGLSEIQVPPFEIDIKGFGYFPEQKKPRVLWAGIEEEPSLMELQRETEEACRSAGLEAESRTFVPHVTLAKVRGGRKKDVMSFINQHKTFRMESIPVTEFVLCESRLYKEGAVHTALETYALNA